jgi:rubrerythrin
MSNQSTLADLMQLAIQLEQSAEMLYRGMAAKFAHHPEIVAFWEHYAAEEVGHARWLERLQRTSSQEQLAAPADPLMLQTAHRLLGFSVEAALNRTRNLEEALQLAIELENSETNAIFEFLIINYSTDRNTIGFLRNQLKNHVANLTETLPTQYKGRAQRLDVKALE